VQRVQNSGGHPPGNREAVYPESSELRARHNPMLPARKARDRLPT
jgi:hypothetical protein